VRRRENHRSRQGYWSSSPTSNKSFDRFTHYVEECSSSFSVFFPTEVGSFQIQKDLISLVLSEHYENEQVDQDEDTEDEQVEIDESTEDRRFQRMEATATFTEELVLVLSSVGGMSSRSMI
jgi:hypothetical protein